MKNIRKIYYTLILFGVLVPFRSVSAEVILGGTGDTKLGNPLNVDSIPKLVTKVLEVVVKVGTPIAIIFMIYAGFNFVTARGNPTKLEDARKTLLWTIVGVVILLGASLLAAIIEGTVKELGVGVF